MTSVSMVSITSLTVNLADAAKKEQHLISVTKKTKHVSARKMYKALLVILVWMVHTISNNRIRKVARNVSVSVEQLAVIEHIYDRSL